MKKRASPLCLFLPLHGFKFIGIFSTSVQAVFVSGKVINEKSDPLSGATVRIKGRKNATTTNEQGAFNFPDRHK